MGLWKKIICITDYDNRRSHGYQQFAVKPASHDRGRSNRIHKVKVVGKKKCGSEILLRSMNVVEKGVAGSANEGQATGTPS